MKIANIVTTSNISLPEQFNIVSSIDEKIDDIPTLIVGYDLTKKLFKDFDILNRQITPNIYWTVKKTEDRDKHQDDLNWFQHKIYNQLISNVNYIIVDPIQQNKKTIKKIINKIYSLNNIISYEKYNMIYIYSDNLIFGIDLNLLKFIGLNTNKIRQKIKKISDTYLIGNEIISYYKQYIEYLNNNVKYIPLLYYIFNKLENKVNFFHEP
jgi:hypothetical protein